MKRLLLILIVSLAAAGGAWYWLYAHGRCGKSRVEASARAMAAIRSRWKDSFELAASSNRITIGQHIGKLQDIRREADGLEVAPCLNRAKMLLLDNMNGTIQYLTTFMGGTDTDVASMRTLAESTKTAGEQYVAEVAFIGRCETPAWMPECAGH